ncbi:hypothetical protein DPM35_20050 [Mesorhizobium atlanticum]|uniref:Uncharacterized protein n=1 Tax=Mesorhizobium atlanticum TaxID=2233532 RepID=A0A330GZ45_9HYPH|nr:hypothetical protein DPM35_20050 [Mesorhizobium atlanticum]
MKSSIIIALGTTAISTISGVLAAWAFERFTFKLVEAVTPRYTGITRATNPWQPDRRGGVARGLACNPQIERPYAKKETDRATKSSHIRISRSCG